MNSRHLMASRRGVVAFSLSLATLAFSVSTTLIDKSEAQDGAAPSSESTQGILTERDISIPAPSPTNEPANQAGPSSVALAVSTPTAASASTASDSSSPFFSAFEVTGGLSQQAPLHSAFSEQAFSEHTASTSAISSSALGTAPGTEADVAAASSSSAPPAMAVTYAARPALQGGSSTAETYSEQPSSMIVTQQSSSMASTSAVSASAELSSTANSSSLVSSSEVSSSWAAGPESSLVTSTSSEAMPTLLPVPTAQVHVATVPPMVAPAPSSAEAILRTPGVSLVDYPVRGVNYAELTKDLDVFATGGTGSTKSDFGFTWVLSWSYTTDSITSQPVVKVTPRFNVELPRWTNFEAATARDRELWAAYRAYLLRGIEARILLVQASVPRAEAEIQAFVTQNPKAKQTEIDGVLNSTIRVLQMRLRSLQATEASDLPRTPLLGIGAQ